MSGWDFSSPSAGGGWDFTSGGSASGGVNFSLPPQSAWDKVSGFGLSVVESFPELFGIEPTVDTASFRARNPISGFASQIVGAFVPYLGMAKAARAVPLIDAGIVAAGNLGKGPIMRGALTAAAEGAVVETGRLALGATPLPKTIYDMVTGGDAEVKPLGIMAGEAAFNIGAGAIGGGLIGGIASKFAKGRSIADITGIGSDQPLLVQVQGLNKIIGDAQDAANPFQLDEATLGRIVRERDKLIQYNLQDVMPRVTDTGEMIRDGYKIDGGAKLFRPLLGDKKDEVANFLNRVANWKSKSPDKLTENLRPIYDPTEAGGFRTRGELEAAIEGLGAGSREELGSLAQDIRYIRVKAGTGKRPGAEPEPVDLPETVFSSTGRVDQSVTAERVLTQPKVYNKPTSHDPLLGRARGLQKRFTNPKVWADVGEGFRLAREKDGMYVMSKKVVGGLEPAPGDMWAVFRTAHPEAFAQRAAASDKIVRASAYWPQQVEQVKIGEPLYDAGVDYKALRVENVPEPKAKLNTAQAYGRDAMNTAATYLAPTGPLATRNQLFMKGFQLLKDLEAHAEKRVATLMHGAQKLDLGKSLLRNVASLDPPKSAGLHDGIQTLDKDDLQAVRTILELELEHGEVVAAHGRGIFSDKVLALMSSLQALSDDFSGRIGKLQEVVQSSEAVKLVADFTARKGHYGITREYPGAYRIYLNDEAGDVVGLATGRSPLEAREAATDLITQASAKGKVITEGGMIDEVLRNPDDFQRLKAKVLRPGFMKNRGDLMGYEIQRGELTHKALSELIEKNVRRRENYIRNVVANEHSAEIRAQLYRQSPQDAMRLEKALRVLGGDEGEFARVQNAIVDKTLAAVGLSGKDSASAIVRETQSLLSAWTFGFGSMTQPVMAMLGTLQTILPEIAFNVHATPGMLARNYIAYPLLDEAGNIKGTLGVLSEFKVFKNSMDRLFSKSSFDDPEWAQLVDDMIRQRQLAPAYAESSYGVNTALLMRPKEAMAKGASFIDILKAANELPMSKSEELSRGLAVAAAYEIAKMRGFDYGRTVVFAREFLAKTNFNYGTVDRATVFTTPLGSLAGTFKNWILHYMANMVRYSTMGPEALPALFWQTASTAAIGGLGATALGPIADGASRWMTDKPAMQNLYDLIGGMGLDERVGDFVMYGLPGALGISLASQSASPGADPARDASMMFSFAALDRVKALGRATKGAMTAWATTGESPWEDSSVRDDLVRTFAPRTVYRSFALTQDMAVRSMNTGYDVTRPLSLGEGVLYGAGFAPVELDKTYEAYNAIRNDQEAQRAQVKELGQTLAQAIDTGDDRLANRVYARAMALGIDPSKVSRSSQARLKRMEETQLEYTASPEDEANWSFMFND